MEKLAAIYTRVSSDARDSQDSVSLNEQLIACQEYADRQGYHVVRTYQDVQSGSDAKRPGFQAMLADARAGQVDVLIAWRQDRLLRGIAPAHHLHDVMEGYGVEIETVGETFNKQLFLVMVGIAKMELDTFRERSRMGKLGAARAGRVPLAQHSLPYGYTRTPEGTLEVVDADAELVRHIFTAYTAGTSTQAIAADLERLTGETWTNTKLHRILGHSAYVGELVFGRSQYRRLEGHSRRITDRPESEQVPIDVPAIVERETWERAQERKAANRKLGRADVRTFYLLQHRARCAECGASLRLYTMKSRNVRKGGKVYRYQYDPPRRFYHCSNRCIKYVRAEPVESQAWREVSAMLTDPQTIADGLATLEDSDSARERERERESLDRLIAKLERQDGRLLDLLLEEAISRAAYDRKHTDLERRQADARALLADLDRAGHAALYAADVARAISDWGEQFAERLDTLTDTERREIMLLAVDSVTINRSRAVDTITLAVGHLASQPST